jgi:hypothetical protein
MKFIPWGKQSPIATFPEADLEALAAAVRRLESPSLAGRLATLAGKPVALVQRALPVTASTAVSNLTKLALERALDMALFSLRNRRIRGGRKLHSGLAGASGAIGGAFGLAALAVELPISTTIMLRAIAAIAQQEGEDLADPRTGLACLEVFALGGPPTDETAAQADYFTVRAMLARGLLEIADLAIKKGAIRESSPLLARFLTKIAARFGVVVSQKVAAQAVAVLGALGGAAVNLAFIEHFQDLARGHFTVRRLENIYGPEMVRREYERLKADLATAPSPTKAPDRGKSALLIDRPRI